MAGLVSAWPVVLKPEAYFTEYPMRSIFRPYAGGHGYAVPEVR